MSALIHLLTKNIETPKKKSFLTRVHNKFSQSSEKFWFCLSLILFIAMGPFSVIAVVMGLWSIAKEQKGRKVAEPASC
jgi:hypothetical protein